MKAKIHQVLITILLIAAGLLSNGLYTRASIPAEITIVLPYEGAALNTVFWANEESKIDFIHNGERGGRCTAAFTATELKTFLQLQYDNIAIYFSNSTSKSGFNIILSITDPLSKDFTYDMEQVPGGISIRGKGRTGLLYGAYDFLRMQGWQWFAPGAENQMAPPKNNPLVLPQEKIKYNPPTKTGRGFESNLQRSRDFWIWMARNKLNIAYTTNTALMPLLYKLGMTFVDGGHVYGSALNPNTIMPTGKILWDEHREWFGLPKNGLRDLKKWKSVQFCASQPEMIAFLGDKILEQLQTRLTETDIMNIWGVDHIGSTQCFCANCQKIGNASDQELHMLSGLRTHLNKAVLAGKLRPNVKLMTIAYDGNSTLEGPLHEIPENLTEAGDKVIVYPINRCYDHNFFDKNCKKNALYMRQLENWFNKSDKIRVIFGEYYNVSKYEDLPLIFINRLREDIPYYVNSIHSDGVTYMHAPINNWGPRTITQFLYASLLSDPKLNVDAFVDNYFSKWYGPYGKDMENFYRINENTWRYISQWRNWSASILVQLQNWDGKPSDKPLSFSDELLAGHFNNANDVINSGKESIKNLKIVVQGVDKLRKEAISTTPYNDRISEDFRLFKYGLNVMEFMTSMVEYYEALRARDWKSGNTIWKNLVSKAWELDSYVVPIPEQYGGGVSRPDVLTRSQLRAVFVKCKQYRDLKPSLFK
ncbi:MAG TPA: DUF4838 domain-containing protein [Agriterribacter sp.]|nr:DUF4838 domain-containing protein [Agriterribacter sp.]